MTTETGGPETPRHQSVPPARYFLWIVILGAIPMLLVYKNKIAEKQSAGDQVTVTLTNYHGWADSLLLRNGKVQAVIVPGIGRVMQFGFAGEEGVFWENRALDGKPVEAAGWETNDWVNYGGDKTWPAPEGDWPKLTGRKNWRPPPAFDAMPVEAKLEGSDVLLTSPVDPFLGIRTQRRVHLHVNEPVMTITTTYERLSGAPAKIGVWVITQLKDPLGLYVPLPAGSNSEPGYKLLGTEPPPSVKVEHGLLSLTRNPRAAHKIGLQADTLVWMSDRFALRIDSPRVAGAEYPDLGSSAEIYTNPDPLRYIELEMLGPLDTLKLGDRIERKNNYTLFRRTDPETEARQILGLRPRG